MNRHLERFQTHVRGLRGQGRRYSGETQGEAIRYWREAAMRGHSRREAVQALGVSVATLDGWVKKAGAASARPELIEVVVGSESEGSGPVVITARGDRIEGLSVAELAQLLVALS